MDIDTDDEVLRTLADGKPMDYEQWPALLERIISRLDKIVHNEFPIPPSSTTLASSQVIPDSSPPQPKTEEPATQSSNSGSSQSTNKENAPPSKPEAPSGGLPAQIQILYTSITSTLQSLFTTHPPHTVQRLAELILLPRQHYRTLPSYLHAVDRVVHVTSGAHIFPLPPAIPDPSSSTVLSNGTDPLSISWGNPASTAPQVTLGSDESLGGALLTPIPWLNRNGNGGSSNGGSVHSPLEGEVKTESTEMIEGPNGPGGIETVSVSVNGISSATREQTAPPTSAPSEGSDVAALLRAEGGITQGELLRQEQRAGVVPAIQLVGNRGDTDGLGEEDEAPHARGPEEIGMEDMGPQSTPVPERRGPGVDMHGIDAERAVGRKGEPSGEEAAAVETDEKGKEGDEEAPGTPKREAEEELGADEKRIKEDSTDLS